MTRISKSATMNSERNIPCGKSVFGEAAAPGTQAETPTLPPTGAEWSDQSVEPSVARPVEIGGRDGPEPTRYGDWELKGRCIDF